ncbi:hypothetical protein R1flu_004309 [Riccia fluitans]|uniref:Uncharacterized protein n=1 Tax=Riccia fluitans TaxID=41844 RepID=A0ABD1YQQ3_9MARC
MDRTTRIGHVVSENVYLVDFVDHSLTKTLGAHDVVFYVAKRMKDLPGISGYDEAMKEMSALPVSHPAIVAPVVGLLDRASPTLVFPWWNGGQIFHWIDREFELRWKQSTNGQRHEPIPDETLAKYDDEMHLSVQLFRRHRLQMAATLL